MKKEIYNKVELNEFEVKKIIMDYLNEKNIIPIPVKMCRMYSGHEFNLSTIQGMTIYYQE